MPDRAAKENSRQKLDEQIDNSLRGSAMRRALRKKVPRTLTPYEWEAWYEEHGVPQEHDGLESWLTLQWRKVKKWLRTRRGK